MAQKSAKTVPENDGGKDMKAVKLLPIKVDTVQDLDGGQNRERPGVIGHQNQRRYCA